MGACASCMGNRRHHSFDEADVSRLLLDDPNNFQYGSFSDQNMNAQSDPLESQQEAEALQKVVARTSNNLVDIFEITPQQTQQAHPVILSGQDARMARYQTILSKLSPDSDIPAVGTIEGHVDWLSDDEVVDMQGKTSSIKEGTGEPLVGTFADAAAVAA